MPKTCFLLTSIVSRSSLDFECLRPPNWSQMGRLGLPGPSPKPPKSSFLGACVQDASQEAPKWLQRGPKEGPEVDFWSIFDGFGSLFSLFLAVSIGVLENVIGHSLKAWGLGQNAKFLVLRTYRRPSLDMWLDVYILLKSWRHSGSTFVLCK